MAIVQCSECGGKVSDRLNSCPHCGALNLKDQQVSPVTQCSECGGKVSDRLNSCPHCGAPNLKDQQVSPVAGGTILSDTEATAAEQRPMSATAAVWWAGAVLLYYVVQFSTVNFEGYEDEIYGVLFIIQFGHVLTLLGLNKSGMYHLTWKVSLGLYIAIELFTYTDAFFAIVEWFRVNG